VSQFPGCRYFTCHLYPETGSNSGGAQDKTRDVSEEHLALIFRAEEQAKEENSPKEAERTALFL
jgi:hypothetical protein